MAWQQQARDLHIRAGRARVLKAAGMVLWTLKRKSFLDLSRRGCLNRQGCGRHGGLKTDAEKNKMLVRFLLGQVTPRRKANTLYERQCPRPAGGPGNSGSPAPVPYRQKW